MVDDDDDDFTYHVRQQAVDKINRDQINTAAHSLITKERTQKLDLLIHLLSNLTQALVVCGPEGIGKTTLLDVLQQRKTELWQYCFMQGNAALSFEAILGQLALDISQGKPNQSLSMALRQYDGQHKKIVLIIDNAGELVPGLISAVIQYAAANPVLRVVFALTHDELQVKRGSDRAVDDCHIVEIPPLSERQCGDFLQELSAKPYENLSFKAISESMIAGIYRSTHGIPGRIIAEISGSSAAKPGGKLKWILTLAVAAAIAIAIAVQWLISSATAPGALPSESSGLTARDGGDAAKLPEAAVMQAAKNNDKEPAVPAPVEQTAAATEAPPQPQAEVRPTPPDQQLVQPQVQSVLLPSAEVPVNIAKDAPTPSVEATSSHKDDQLPVPPAAVGKPMDNSDVKVQPEPVSAPAVAQKQDNKQSALVQQKTVSPTDAPQEKPKQAELAKTVNNVEPPAPEKSAVKDQSMPVNAGVGQGSDNKPSVVVQQNKAERLWLKQEELRKAELSKKTINSVEPPPAPNNLETIQIPQKPAEIAAVPSGPVIETLVPQQVEPDGAVQSSDNFTLQLMVLSKQSSADDMRKKYPALEPDIRVIKTIANGKEKFILQYGSYSDAVSANKARQSLPFEFHNALVRKITR